MENTKTKPEPKLLVFASGTEKSGGSCFEQLAESQKYKVLHGKIVGVVSNYLHGGVRMIADTHEIPFFYLPEPNIHGYQRIMRDTGAEWAALFGWLKKIEGYDPKTTFNIHPARKCFGGRGMYGIHVHRAVLHSFLAGYIKDTAISTFFVTDEFDKGPVFFEHPVPVYRTDTPEILEERVKQMEHLFQPVIANLVINGKISWDGKNSESLVVPKGYRFLPK